MGIALAMSSTQRVGKQQYANPKSFAMKADCTNFMPNGADCLLIHCDFIGYLPSTGEEGP